MHLLYVRIESPGKLSRLHLSCLNNNNNIIIIIISSSSSDSSNSNSSNSNVHIQHKCTADEQLTQCIFYL